MFCYSYTLTIYFMRAAPKVMPPIWICFPTTEGDGGIMVADAQPSHQYSITCCCHMTDGSWEEVWQNGVWHGCVYKPKVWNWISTCGKNVTTDIHWCLLNVYGDQTENVSTVRQWGVHFSSGKSYSGLSLLMEVFYEYGMQLPVHHWQDFSAVITACLESLDKFFFV